MVACMSCSDDPARQKYHYDFLSNFITNDKVLMCKSAHSVYAAISQTSYNLKKSLLTNGQKMIHKVEIERLL